MKMLPRTVRVMAPNLMYVCEPAGPMSSACFCCCLRFTTCLCRQKNEGIDLDAEDGDEDEVLSWHGDCRTRVFALCPNTCMCLQDMEVETKSEAESDLVWSRNWRLQNACVCSRP